MITLSKKRKYILVSFIILSLLLFVFLLNRPHAEDKRISWWEFQAIDTMKYSRDIAREKLDDPSFDFVIDQQVKDIAQIGATHVAIGTPYDEEFLPFLKRWVAAARKYNLKVWFRGNWSGWEHWFSYPPITRDEHIAKTKDFILNNSSLFENGDVFTPCSECENGGSGDPRRTGDIVGYRQFLINEYTVTKQAFKDIGKDVKSNYNSTNGDVARLIMDKDTTKAMDGVVVIDHYVASSDNLVKDIKEISQRSEGKVVLGEFGAPIPDIHGNLTPSEQAQWIEQALVKLAETPELVGINYWVNVGGSTSLWNAQGNEKAAAFVIRSFYSPQILNGVIKDEIGRPIINAKVNCSVKETLSDKNGKFSIPYLRTDTILKISAQGFNDKDLFIDPNSQNLQIVMIKKQSSIFFRILKFLLFFKNIR